MEISITWCPDPHDPETKLSSVSSFLSQEFLEGGHLNAEEMADIVFRETFQRLNKARVKGKHVVENRNNPNLKVAIDQGASTHSYNLPTKIYLSLKRAVKRLRRR